MKLDKRFNKFYTIIAGAASISMLYQFLSSYGQLKWEISGLFMILISSFFSVFFIVLVSWEEKNNIMASPGI